MDADDEQDMEDQASSRTRSRSSSFYNVGGDEESGDGDDMSQEDFDRMMEEAGRSGKAKGSQRWYKVIVVALSSALWPHAHPTIPLTRRPSLTTAHTTIIATSSTRAHAVELHDERA